MTVEDAIVRKLYVSAMLSTAFPVQDMITARQACWLHISCRYRSATVWIYCLLLGLAQVSCIAYPA